MKFDAEQEDSPSHVSDAQFYLILLAVMAAVSAAAMTYLGLDLHRNFLTIAADTAENQSAIVNTLHGHWFRVTVIYGPNLLAFHSHFIFLLIAPLYALFPSPDTLFTLQIWAVYSTVIPLYLAAQEVLKRPPAAFLVAASALVNPLLLQMALAPFHPETWIAAAVFWSYYFYRRNRAVGFWSTLGLALTSGEEAAFIYVALGMALFLVDDGVAWRKRYGIFMVAAGLGWLFVSAGVIAPLMHVTQQLNLFGYHYAQWNVTSARGLVLALVENPGKTVATLLDPQRWGYLAVLVGSPFLLLLLSRQSLFLLAPFPIYFLMSDQEFFLYFHAYYFSFVLFAGYLGLLFLLMRRNLSTQLGAGVMALTFFLNLLTFCVALTFYVSLSTQADEASSQALHAAFDQIPAEAGVYGPHRYSAYLSARENMVMGDLRDKNFDFNTRLDAQFATTRVHADQIDYIICDYITDQCGWRRGWYDPATTQLRHDNVNRLLQSGQWLMVWNQDDVVILKRVRNSR